MIGDAPRFLPDRLRPRRPHRAPRRRLVLMTVIPALVLVLPMWRVGEVRVEGCPKLPAVAVRSLNELVGQPALALDLEGIRDSVELWPVVGDVDVRFQLPGTLLVRVAAAEVLGSVRVGRGWHGVCVDGGLAGALTGPRSPVLEGFDGGAADRRQGLDVALRLAAACRRRVIEVERVTPTDLRVLLAAEDGGRTLTVHVRPEGTDAEGVWCSALAGGTVDGVWADLRWSDRMVLSGPGGGS
ncbi:MAG: cell division protein FtsQ/DivIB [Thermoanaerobaculales bacterium]